MHTHPNARLTPLSLERLLRRQNDGGEPLKELVVQAGISLRTATSGSLVTAQEVIPHWQIDVVFATHSDGRSMRSNCSTPSTSGTIAAL